MYNSLILVALLGLSVGSFLNVVISRLDDLRSIFFTRSQCPECRTKLAWRDLVPVISFALLKGRCRYCGKPISWQYPVVEVGTMLVWLLIFLPFGWSWSFLFYVLIFSALIVIVVSDLKTQMVPDNIIWSAAIVALLGGWYFGGFSLLSLIWGALIGGGSLAALVLYSKERWMGSGDIGVGLIMGLLLGYPLVVLGMFLAFVIGSAVALIGLATKLKTMKDALPFTPFLILATLVALLYGQELINWYLDLITPF